MDRFHLIRYIIAGTFQRDFIVTSSGKTFFDIPGGSIPYAATGFAIWDTGLGLIGSVGEDFPQSWFSTFEDHGFDTRGMSILPETIDLRSFIFYLDNKRYESLNPITQFSQLGLEIPKTLLGYLPEQQRVLSTFDRQKTLIKTEQIPPDYLDASTAHICPLHIDQQTKLISHLQGHVNTLSLDLTESSVSATSLDTLFALLKNIHILQVAESKIRTLFKGRLEDIWEMIEALAAYGIEMIIIKRGGQGQFVYDCYSNKRWCIPAYPSRIMDTTGCGNAFCGGFIAGYRKSYDPVEAALYGNISASFSIEGTGAFYPLSVLPGLAEARITKLRDMVTRL
jgi:hypothetical protein